MVNRFATGRGVVQRRWSREQTFGRWLLGALAVLVVAGGGIGAVVAASTTTGTSVAQQSDAQNAALSAASRLEAWTGAVGNELNDYAAAIVLDTSVAPSQLAANLQTMLTGTNDFWLLEFTSRSGQVIAASNGAGVGVGGASWLGELSATPLVTRVTMTGGVLEWFVARLATTDGYQGVLVAALQASQVGNLLSPADPSGSAEIQAVLPGGVLLYSTAMTTTLHAGLSDASMVADGSLSKRVNSPGVAAALAHTAGVTSYRANGVDTIAGYDGVALPGWVLGVVVTERATSAAAPGLLNPAWLLPGLAAVIGLGLIGMLIVTRGGGALGGVTSGLGAAGPGAALPALRRRLRPPTGPARATGGRDPQPAADGPGGEATVVGARSVTGVGRPGGRRRLRGRYEILEVTGSGGEGQVLRALDHLHARQVAIKVRALDPGDRAKRQEILNEASVLLRMTPHPHASVVREDFIIGDRYYLVMDWIEGTPLNRVLAEQGCPGLPLARVLEWMGQVADVLDHLHTQSPVIVHGDVKPSNVIVTSGPDPRAILVDFGISQQRDSPNELGNEPAPRGVMGSPGFTAPEMVLGGQPTPMADIFALAATTYALLLGEPPRLSRPPNWGVVAPGASQVVEAAFKAGLAVDPSRRPRSAGAFVAALRSTSAPIGALDRSVTTAG